MEKLKVSPILPFNSPAQEDDANNNFSEHVGRISLSGVQPKFGLVMRENGILTKPAEGQQTEYILKPAPFSPLLLERTFCPANEHLTMLMASQVYHIETADNALVHFQDGEPAYLCRRFDISPTGEKYLQEDFASLAGLTRKNGGSDYKYSHLSYEECGDIIRKYAKAAAIELLKFYRIVVYNYLTLNDDAHLKNFSLINRGDGEYHLSPAYDLLNTSLHLWEPRIFALEKGLFREGMKLTDTRTIGRNDFEEFGRRLGLAERTIKRELDFFGSDQPLAKELIDGSTLSDKLKKSYWLSYKYRRITLV